MKISIAGVASLALILAAFSARAQVPGGPPGGPGGPPSGPGGPPQASRETADQFVARMMAFDKNEDGKLSKEELSEKRLHRLFDRADADHDGIASKQEPTELATKELANDREGPGGFGPPGGGPFGPPGGGPPGFGPPGGEGRGGPMMGPPRPGDVLPPVVRDRLELSDEQVMQLDELQLDVDARLAKILTGDQKKIIQQMRERRGGPPQPGGPRGYPGGPPGDRPAQPKD
jgi:Spy/CpxP family protein refolding chaperone